jgi:16S rRNA (cytosine1402-N4)-methyltransferase
MIGVAGVVERAYHVPVMVAEVLKWMAPRVGGTYLDGTVGGGGHAEAILVSAEGSRVYAVDRDPDAVEAARRRLLRFGDRVRVELGDYADACEIFDLGEGTLDGVTLDLGVSSHQIDFTERGFTFRPGAPLDMRMGGEGHGGQTAADLLNQASEGELRDLFRRYGEERGAGRLAREIVSRRSWKPFERSDDLVAAYEAARGRPAAPADRARIGERGAGVARAGVAGPAVGAAAGGSFRGSRVSLIGGPRGEAGVPAVEPGLRMPSGDPGVPVRR